MFNSFIVDTVRLKENVQSVKLQNPNSLICAMVKANAYGVGLNQVVKVIDDFVDFYGVAYYFEAEQVRNISNKKILIVGPIENEINEDFSFTCGSECELDFLINSNKKVKIHLKINTGMNRYGFDDLKNFKNILEKIKNSKLILEGIYTHFATTDEHVEKQMKRFLPFVKVAKTVNKNLIVHADNSGVNEIKNHHLNMVRIGHSLYVRKTENFKPVVKIQSKILEIKIVDQNELVGYSRRCVLDKKTKVAIVSIGYADGFDLRYIGMKLKVLGRKCRVLNVCMDCFMLDIGNLKLKKGDVVEILNDDNSILNYSNYTKNIESEIVIRFSHLRGNFIFL
ncbi:MAG: alanine racemase [Clostridiales bacterium]|nr:alanine racemase [Clostridiales bacterium]